MERAEDLVALGDAAQDVKVAGVHLVTGLQIDYGPLCPQEPTFERRVPLWP